MRRITDEQLFADLGFTSLRALVAERMPVGVRALEEYRKLADDMALLPKLEVALEEGLDLGRIGAVARIATDDDVVRWLALARHTGMKELNRAVRFAARGVPGDVYIDVDPDPPEAARWFLETVKIPRQSGIGKLKERDHHTCQNPECHRVGIRAQAHHIQWMSLGGSDDPGNLIAVCKPCHLRLIHAGHVTVEYVGDRLLWTYPGRRVWVC